MKSISFQYFAVALVAGLLFIPFLGQVHLFDWDEINFAECAREMIVSKDYLRMQINFQPFYEKPPLFIWLQVLSMKAFGVTEFAARFPNAIVGILTLVSLLHVGRKVAGDKVGQWWVLLYAATWLPHFYFKTAIIDPLFNYLIFMAFYHVYLLAQQRLFKNAFFAGILLGLAVLTKGPVAIVVAGLSFVVFFIIKKGKTGISLRNLLIIAVAALLIIGTWFSVEYLKNGSTFLREFISYQAGLFSQNIADHAEPWYYHPLVLLIGCFPVSLLLFQYFKKSKQEVQDSKEKDFRLWMWILFWVVLILFSIVKTKIVHYSSLCYFPMTYLAAVVCVRLSKREYRVGRVVQIGLFTIGIALAAAIAALPFVGLYKAKLIPYIEDVNAVGNLQADVVWHWSEALWGLLYLLGMVIALVFIRKHFRKAMIALCLLQLLILQVTVLHFTPKIEAYSQRAVIDFWKSQAGKDVYLFPLGYKSYAHYFYGKTKEAMPTEEGRVMVENNEKAIYLACKSDKVDEYKANPKLQFLYEKNGFGFFLKPAN